MRLMLILLLALSSCNGGFNIDVEVHESLIPIVDEFYYEAELRGFHYPRSVSVVLNPRMTEVGLFYRRAGVIKMQQKFVLDRVYKDSANYNYVKLAVFHEMGHWLGQRHRGGVSIMNTHPDFGQCACGDFVKTVQFYNADKKNQRPIIDEFYSQH